MRRDTGRQNKLEACGRQSCCDPKSEIARPNQRELGVAQNSSSLRTNLNACYGHWKRACGLVACWHDSSLFDHDAYAAFRRARPMYDAFRNSVALVLLQNDSLTSLDV